MPRLNGANCEINQEEIPMRTDEMRESQNVEDRRGSGPKMALGGGIGGIILVIIVVLLGGNPQQLLQNLGPPQGGTSGPAGSGVGSGANPAQEKQAAFVSKVLGSTEDVWTELFRASGKRYVEPHLVMFTGRVESACGLADAAVGPFYCPADSKVYIDLGFYDELSERFGAPGDFAQAYVIAHEVGHHVQNLLGISEKVHALQQRASKEEANKLSVLLELQADFFAGVWANHAQSSNRILEAGDLEEALRCASAIGDDKLQMQARGYVVPESFTHGSAAQRVKWFRKGFETGDLSQGDTFSEERR